MTPASASWTRRISLALAAALVVLLLAWMHYPDAVSTLLARGFAKPAALPASAPAYNPAALTWTEATSSAPWEARDSGEAYVFNNKIYFMGGLDGNGHIDVAGIEEYWNAPHFNDIWSTADGANWTLETAHAEFPPRRSMSVFEFKGKLWMLGGYSPTDGLQSDIWNSDDGVHWVEVEKHAAFIPREGQTVEQFNGKLWIIGGVNYDLRKALNDVWSSDDGLTWVLATSSAAWSPRWDFDTEVFNGRMYLASGMDLTLGTFNDVWVTDDGVNWSQLTAHAPWEGRQGGQLVGFHGYLWMVGRLNDAFDKYGPNDVWFSQDGIVWQKTNVDPGWVGREDDSVEILNNRMYIFQGMGVWGDSWRWTNDVWVSSE